MNQCAITLKTIFVALLVDVNWEAGSHPSLNVMRKHERAIWFVDRMKQVHFLNRNKSMTISRETSATELLWRRCWRKSNSINIAIQHSTNQAWSLWWAMPLSHFPLQSWKKTFQGLHLFFFPANVNKSVWRGEGCYEIKMKKKAAKHTMKCSSWK